MFSTFWALQPIDRHVSLVNEYFQQQFLTSVLSQTINRQLHVFGYHGQEIEIMFMAAKVNCLGHQPGITQSFFLAGFLEMKISNDF